jgi:uncharacterized protein YjiS (DUF1127 family)
MSHATELHNATTSQNQFLGRLAGWIAAELDRRRTIRALGACRQSELHDVGITAQDIVALTHCRGAEGVDELCRNVGIRSGNW